MEWVAMVSGRVGTWERGCVKGLGPWEEGGVRVVFREGGTGKTPWEVRRLDEEKRSMRYSEEQKWCRGFKMRNCLIFNFNPLAMLWHGVMSLLINHNCLVLVVALGNWRKRACVPDLGCSGMERTDQQQEVRWEWDDEYGGNGRETGAWVEKEKQNCMKNSWYCVWVAFVYLSVYVCLSLCLCGVSLVCLYICGVFVCMYVDI